MKLRHVQAVAFAALFFVPLARAQTVTIAPERASGVYEPGEVIRWNVAVTDPAKLSSPTYTIKTGGLTSTESGALALVNGKATLSATLSSPGWVHLEVDGKTATGASLQVFGGAIVAGDRILPSSTRPADFETFWKAKLEEQAAVPLVAVETLGTSDRTDVKYSTVKIDGIRGSHIQGQVARPVNGAKFPALLIPQWAGVYSLQKSWATYRASQGWLVFNFQAHDVTPIESDAYFQNLSNTTLKDYWRQGNEDKETSYFLRMYVACQRAAEYLTTRPDWDGRVLVVMGASQGGLQALVTGALHPKVTAVLAEVPAGSDQGGLDAGRVPGWPQWAWQAWDRDVAKVKETARYYDVTHFIPMIRCPVLMGCGLGDAVVPPPGVFASYNLLKGARQMVVMPTADHINNHGPYSAPQEAWLEEARLGKLPVLRVSPQPIAAKVGDRVAFSVVASDVQALGYQWVKDGVVLPGETSDRLVIASVNNVDVGDYVVVVTGPGGSVSSAPAKLSIDAGAPASPRVTLANISTRAWVGTGNDLLIAGFVVGGQGAKKVLIRGVGPSLKAFGIDNAMSDPSLTLTTGANSLIESNDNWTESPKAAEIRAAFPAAGAFGLPEASKDAALLVTLPPGNYTALLQGKGGTHGVALVEVYDLDSGSLARLINISSRGHVDAANPMIAGFVVQGEGSKSVHARGIGPGLDVFGLNPLVNDPELLLVTQKNEEIARNRSWETSSDAANLQATSAFAGASPSLKANVHDSALTTSLNEGVYTAILEASGVDAGVSLVEIYELAGS